MTDTAFKSIETYFTMGQEVTELYNRVKELNENLYTPEKVGFRTYDEVLEELVNTEEKIHFLRKDI